MKHWKILSLVCLLLFVTADVQAKKYFWNKWKIKGDKMALLYRPDAEGRWRQVTDFIFDADYGPSLSYGDKKRPWTIPGTTLIKVRTSEGSGVIDHKGQIIIPCCYDYIEDKLDGSAKTDILKYYYIWGKLSNGKIHLYHVRLNGDGYHKNSYYTVKQLNGEYDNVRVTTFYNSENINMAKPDFTVEIDGKIGKVRWNAQKEQFDRILLCEYTEMKIDSISKLDLKATTPKWVTKKYGRIVLFGSSSAPCLSCRLFERRCRVLLFGITRNVLLLIRQNRFYHIPIQVVLQYDNTSYHNVHRVVGRGIDGLSHCAFCHK